MTRDDLLRAILENPGDDTPRLAFADEIEDTEPERAEFIRVQCELPTFRWDCTGGHDCSNMTPCGGCYGYREMERREQQLWVDYGREWFVNGSIEAVRLPSHVSQSNFGNVVGVVSRGFVSGVHLPLDSFAGETCRDCLGAGAAYATATNTMVGGCPGCSEVVGRRGTGRTGGVAKALFSVHPLTRVVLIGVEPANVRRQSGGERCYTWFAEDAFDGPYQTVMNNNRSRLPRVLGLHADGQRRVNFCTRDEAADALSEACISLGRKLAGLPPLGGPWREQVNSIRFVGQSVRPLRGS